MAFPGLRHQPPPDPDISRATTIGFVNDAEPARAALLESPADFGLVAAAARSAWEETLAATAPWREFAAGNGITDAGCDRFAPAIDRFRDP